MPTDTAIVWFRRDLRLTDQAALAAALDSHRQVLPVYIADFAGDGAWAPGGAARWWLHHSLQALDTALRQRGARLIIRSGDSLAELRRLAGESGAGAVYWNRLYEPAAIARDRHIKAALRDDGLAVSSCNSALWREPWQIKTGGGEAYRVFTPFWRTLQAQLPPLDLRPAPARIEMPRPSPPSLALDALQLLPRPDWAAAFTPHWQPGEAGALQALGRFVDAAVGDYRQQRDRPAAAGTSRLSPHLHFGELSPQQARAALLRSGADGSGGEHFLRELGWREFAHHLLYAFPDTPEQPLYERFAQLPWRQPCDYRDDLRAWQRGATGIPIVDAGMRELWTCGWMHNRVRMIVASFLTKNLLIPWQEGARWFWDTLVDADLANNTLGWQWTAGCGADAAPYFRVFNPVLQAQKFDADGAYIRRWVPELRGLPAPAIHAPWLAPPRLLAEAGFRPGRDYPAPIVDLAASRERALAAYAAIKGR